MSRHAFKPGDSVRIPMGNSIRYRWSAQVLEVSPDGKFVKVGGNGVLRKGGKWIEASRVTKYNAEEQGAAPARREGPCPSS